jgi:hypothetical protein
MEVTPANTVFTVTGAQPIVREKSPGVWEITFVEVKPATGSTSAPIINPPAPATASSSAP